MEVMVIYVWQCMAVLLYDYIYTYSKAAGHYCHH